MLIAVGIALGVTVVASTAACLPDAPAAVQSTDTDPAANYDPSQDDGIFNPSDPADNPETYLDYITIGSMNAALLTPCELEDSRDCYWDAGNSGNGVGESFVDIKGIAYYEGQLPVWHNFTRGDVIVCDSPLAVETDDYPAGQDPAMPNGGTWAHCD